MFRVPTDAHELAGQLDITPAPERLEEIEKEELIGHRPVRAYKGDVIGHLLHQGHEDEVCRETQGIQAHSFSPAVIAPRGVILPGVGNL